MAQRYGARIDRLYSAALNGYSVELSEAQTGKLAADPAVKSVVQNSLVTLDGVGITQPDPPSWGLDRIDQRALPLDQNHSHPDQAGEGVTAYITNGRGWPIHRPPPPRVGSQEGDPKPDGVCPQVRGGPRRRRAPAHLLGCGFFPRDDRAELASMPVHPGNDVEFCSTGDSCASLLCVGSPCTALAGWWPFLSEIP
ncbi:S8 family serine peptidase [Streptomyces sp. NPDC093093]|uniref:S8 family serine peptidase n=1 Tax=Streptomyces sp. NPDC093093 TaxID=3366025 RepID=UPI0038097877